MTRRTKAIIEQELFNTRDALMDTGIQLEHEKEANEVYRTRIRDFESMICVRVHLWIRNKYWRLRKWLMRTFQ